MWLSANKVESIIIFNLAIRFRQYSPHGASIVDISHRTLGGLPLYYLWWTLTFLSLSGRVCQGNGGIGIALTALSNKPVVTSHAITPHFYFIFLLNFFSQPLFFVLGIVVFFGWNFRYHLHQPFFKSLFQWLSLLIFIFLPVPEKSWMNKGYDNILAWWTKGKQQFWK